MESLGLQNLRLGNIQTSHVFSIHLLLVNRLALCLDSHSYLLFETAVEQRQWPRFSLELLLKDIFRAHSPQTSLHSAPHVYRWARRWARPACRCSRSTTGTSRRLPGPGCRSLAGGRRGQRGRAPFLQPGSDPPPVCAWLPPRSHRSYIEGGKRGRFVSVWLKCSVLWLDDYYFFFLQ